MQKQINKIDKLPSRFYNIETLYVSNNSIASLEGIEQFRNLVNLSLANNEVRACVWFCVSVRMILCVRGGGALFLNIIILSKHLINKKIADVSFLRYLKALPSV